MDESSAEKPQDPYKIQDFLTRLRTLDPSPDHSLKVPHFSEAYGDLTQQLIDKKITSDEFTSRQRDLYEKDENGNIKVDPNAMPEEIRTHLTSITTKVSYMSEVRKVDPSITDEIVVEGVRIILDKFPAETERIKGEIRTQTEEKHGNTTKHNLMLRPALVLFEENKGQTNKTSDN